MASYNFSYDHCAYWRDIRTIGTLSKSVPYQSCVALLLDETLDNRYDSERSYCMECQTNESNCHPETHVLPVNPSSTVGKILSQLPPRIEIQQRMDDTVFWDFSSAEYIGSFPEQTKSGIIEVSNENIPNKHQRISNPPPDIKMNSLSEVQSKLNQFETAKSKFTKEGGKIEKISQSLKLQKQPNEACSDNTNGNDELPPELLQFEKHLVEKIESDIIHKGQPITFDDIAGLDFAKKTVQEIIVWPMSRPDLFKGIRAVPKGLLLFGPPGTGKTLIGKAISYQIGATFFSISASSLTSKWIGEGEKTVRTLFGVAVYKQPSVIFIDEIDSLLCQRSSDENEASRRMKTEFLVQIDGASTSAEARVVLIGATNRPDELDEAARRRFVKRLYIPLPDHSGRRQLFETLLEGSIHELSENDIKELVDKSIGFSGADIRSLCTEAAMGPVRDIAQSGVSLQNISVRDVPPISKLHFDLALGCVQPSVSNSDLERYIDWNSKFGSFRKME